MKLFLIIGSIIATAIIIAVSYLLFFADPTNTQNDQFGDFNFEDTTVDESNFAPEESEGFIETITDPILIQISENPVLGFAEIGTSSSPFVIYVESGTGHIFKYDVSSGLTDRISNTTIQNPRAAVVSEDGGYVVVAAGAFVTDELVIIELPQGTSTVSSIARIDARADNIDIINGNVLVYTTTNNGNTIGNQYDLGSNASLGTAFTVPFSNAVVQWSADVDGRHYAYPKPSDQLYGAAYAIQADRLERQPLSSYGLSAIANDRFIFASNFEENENLLLDRSSDFVADIGDFALPDKCVFHSSNAVLLACAQNSDFNRTDDITAWRQGTLITSDSFVLTNLDTFEIIVFDIAQYSNITHDIDQMHYRENLLFRSRVSQSLWMVNLSTYLNTL